MAKKKAAAVETAGGTEIGNASVPTNGKTNISAAVKAYMSAHPDAKPKQISEALAAQDIKVAPNYVSMIKSKAKAGGSGSHAKKTKATETHGSPKAKATGGGVESGSKTTGGLYPLEAFTSAAKLLKSVSASDAIALIRAMAD